MAMEKVFGRHRAEVKTLAGVYGAAYEGDEGELDVLETSAALTAPSRKRLNSTNRGTAFIRTGRSVSAFSMRRRHISSRSGASRSADSSWRRKANTVVSLPNT